MGKENNMASHYVFYEEWDDFIKDLEQHNPDLVRKMVKSILVGIKRKLDKVVPIEATFRNSETEIVEISKANYEKVLKSNLIYLIATDEDWLLCAKIRDALKKLSKCTTTKTI